MKPHILCATDFSTAGDEAAQAALALAARFRTDLELVHVVGPFGERVTSLQELGLLESFVDIAKRRLANKVTGLKHPEVHVTSRVVEARGKSSVAYVLRNLVAESHPKIVVVGTHGRSEFNFWPMGSFAETLAETLDAPVMVIHSARAIASWGANDSILRLVAAVELSKEALPVLSALKEFREAGDCELTACHVKHVPLPVDSMLGAFDAAPGSPQRLEEDDKKLRELIARHVGTTEVETDVEIANLSTGSQIVDIAHERKADILVVGTHHRGYLSRLFLGSVSRQVLRASAVNVLCVPVQIKQAPVEAEDTQNPSRSIRPAEALFLP